MVLPFVAWTAVPKDPDCDAAMDVAGAAEPYENPKPHLALRSRRRWCLAGPHTAKRALRLGHGAQRTDLDLKPGQ